MRELLAAALETWVSFFSNQPIVRTLIGFLHVGGLLAGGGCAIYADRALIMAGQLGTAERAAQLQALKGTHRIVLAGLASIIVSGLFLFAADLETYLYSKLFWTKMGLTALLLVNGGFLIRAERRAENGDARGWRGLMMTSVTSILLWFLTTLAGSGLVNIG